MFKQIAFGISLTVLFLFWGYSYSTLREENSKLRGDNMALLSQISAIQEAALLREEQYRKIEEDYNNLNQQVEELKDEESVNWLDAHIPVNVDNTIPF